MRFPDAAKSSGNGADFDASSKETTPTPRTRAAPNTERLPAGAPPWGHPDYVPPTPEELEAARGAPPAPAPEGPARRQTKRRPRAGDADKSEERVSAWKPTDREALEVKKAPDPKPSADDGRGDLFLEDLHLDDEKEEEGAA